VSLNHRGNAVDLGGGVTITYCSWDRHDPVGFIERHLGEGGAECVGTILFDLPGVAAAFPGRDLWRLNSLDPLDLYPSIRCGRCGHHGWIRKGRWEPA
jgi:hypothetical protein